MPKNVSFSRVPEISHRLRPRFTGGMSRVKLQEAGLFVGRAFLIGCVRVRRKTIRRRSRPT
jgi:hypothetical protein